MLIENGISEAIILPSGPVSWGLKVDFDLQITVRASSLYADGGDRNLSEYPTRRQDDFHNLLEVSARSRSGEEEVDRDAWTSGRHNLRGKKTLPGCLGLADSHIRNRGQ